MNYYIELIGKSIDYIEEKISDNISLNETSKEVHLSQYHFDRLFNIIVGTSFKQYVLGRKLTVASEKLMSSNTSILDIALDFGFQYSEVFSRAFKKQFGISPKTFRDNNPKIERVNKAEIIPRALVTYNGGLVLKASYIFMEEMKLQGTSEVVDIYKYGFEKDLEKAANEFLLKTSECKHLDNNKFYSLTSCHGEGSSTYTVYYGKEILEDIYTEGLEKRVIPRSWYACFNYEGGMSDVRATFTDDLFRWIAVKEIKLNPVGIGMISIYDKDYFEKGDLRILVPVEEPEK